MIRTPFERQSKLVKPDFYQTGAHLVGRFPQVAMTARGYFPICSEKALCAGRAMIRNILHSNTFRKPLTVGLVLGSLLETADLADSSRPGVHFAQPLVRKIGGRCA